MADRIGMLGQFLSIVGECGQYSCICPDNVDPALLGVDFVANVRRDVRAETIQVECNGHAPSLKRFEESGGVGLGQAGKAQNMGVLEVLLHLCPWNLPSKSEVG